MQIFFTEQARKEFFALDNAIQIRFKEAIVKLGDNPKRKHMKLGLPYHVIKVTKQSRLIYDIEGKSLYILHCFSTHKKYERWYKG